MIKFFRKIRQNLLSEGKTGKYLKYAIGEIVLVVIGILIALQLNNWNNNRINAKKEQFYLQAIKIDLVNQVNAIDNQLEFLQSEINILDTIRSSYRETGSFSKIENINGLLFKLISLRVFEIHINTFNELNTTGQIALIHNDELRATVLSTFQNIIEVDYEIQSNYDKVFYPNVFPVISSLVNYRHPEHLRIAINDKLNTIDTQLQLSNSLVLELLVLKVSEESLIKLRPKITELISLIESEINEN